MESKSHATAIAAAQAPPPQQSRWHFLGHYHYSKQGARQYEDHAQWLLVWDALMLQGRCTSKT